MNLYRKYRSQKFADLVGQEHVVQVLSNALCKDNIGHAYLFSGPRGTGKTSVARLLAKSLNCQNRKPDIRQQTSGDSYEPCNNCQSCKEIVAGNSMDVIEIDAASNRGIDEIRELRDKIKFAPSGNKYKVFIIDEVHMLTREAFNALLKTLEEPPAHAIFVLATTELHKVPDTIISRTQQFDFRRANMTNLITRLKHIASKEKINIDDESLKLISRAAEGSYRDAISHLDQVSSISAKITTVETRSVLGLSEWQTTINFLDLVAVGKTKELFDLIDKLYLGGIDFSQFTSDLIDLVRRVMLAKIGYQDALESFNDEQIKQLNNITNQWQMTDFIRYIKMFDQAKREMKTTFMAQLPLEMAALELTTNNLQQTTNNLQLTTNNKQPTTNNLQLITNNKQPTTNNLQQTTNNKQRISKTAQISNFKTQNDSAKLKMEERKPVSSIKYQVSSIKNQSSDQILNTKYEILDTKKKPDKKIKEEEKKKTTDKSKVSLENLKKDWPEIIEKLIAKNYSLSILIKDSVPLLLTSGLLTIGVPFKFYKDRLDGKKIYADVCETIQEHLEISELKLTFKIDSALIVKQTTHNPQPTTQNSNSKLVSDAMEVFGK